MTKKILQILRPHVLVSTLCTELVSTVLRADMKRTLFSKQRFPNMFADLSSKNSLALVTCKCVL